MQRSVAAPSMIRASSLGLVLMSVWLAGCQQGHPLAAGGNGWQAPAPHYEAYASQLRDLEQRTTELDSNNRDLHTQLAQSQQQQQLLREQVELLQQRLKETATELREAQLAKQEADRKAETILASERRGGATITANNSWRKSLKLIEVPGLQIRQETDVIRIILPADQLFRPGTAELQAGAASLLDKAALAITSNYPKQLVVVEGHTDSGPLQGTGYVSHQQLTAAQTVVIFDHLTRRSQLPARQLSTMSYGANHPRASNGTPAGQAENRRIELVVYPETL